MAKKKFVSRRSTLKGIGAIGASAFIVSKPAYAGGATGGGAEQLTSSDVRKQISKKVFETPFIDTHEHLIEETSRLKGRSRRGQADDWTFIFTHYLNSDLLTAGMPKKSYEKFFSERVDPIEKWALLKPYWPAVKNTGYGQAVSITISRLYGVDELSARTVAKVQAGYEKVRRAGFYKRILRDMANIESCQVNCLEGVPFMESAQPTLLMQDLSILGMLDGPDFKQFGRPTGIKVKSLADWHRVMDFWFDKYAKYAVAVKSQNAYSRDIDY